jgi:hypothetical protein
MLLMAAVLCTGVHGADALKREGVRSVNCNQAAMGRAGRLGAGDGARGRPRGMGPGRPWG